MIMILMMITDQALVGREQVAWAKSKNVKWKQFVVVALIGNHTHTYYRSLFSFLRVRFDRTFLNALCAFSVWKSVYILRRFALTQICFGSENSSKSRSEFFWTRNQSNTQRNWVSRRWKMRTKFRPKLDNWHV